MQQPAQPTPAQPTPAFVSRGGLKLHHALTTFGIAVKDLLCADMGCSTGGFTDCLLQHHAAKVFAIDTAYGELAWKLRNDPRVVVMERTNALRATLPHTVDLVVVDLGWTTQRRLLPVARGWLHTPNITNAGTNSDKKPPLGIITLIKPHYECKDLGLALPRGGVLDDAQAEEITHRVIDELTREHAVRLRSLTLSPVLGGAAKASTADAAKTKGTGNREWLAWFEPAT